MTRWNRKILRKVLRGPVQFIITDKAKGRSLFAEECKRQKFICRRNGESRGDPSFFYFFKAGLSRSVLSRICASKVCSRQPSKSLLHAFFAFPSRLKGNMSQVIQISDHNEKHEDKGICCFASYLLTLAQEGLWLMRWTSSARCVYRVLLCMRCSCC